jgi:hypothetical protein
MPNTPKLNRFNEMETSDEAARSAVRVLSAHSSF